MIACYFCSTIDNFRYRYGLSFCPSSFAPVLVIMNALSDAASTELESVSRLDLKESGGRLRLVNLVLQGLAYGSDKTQFSIFEL